MCADITERPDLLSTSDLELTSCPLVLRCFYFSFLLCILLSAKSHGFGVFIDVAVFLEQSEDL